MTACAVSVVLSFAVAGISSALIRWYVGAPAAGAIGAFPAVSVVAEAVAAGLLVGISYGALGIALGTLCRSAAGGVAAALLWYALVDGFLYELSINADGLVQRVYNAFPLASVVTLTSMFGSPGGGASSATYQPVSPWAAALILLGYTVAFLGLAWLRLRDIAAARGAWFARRRHLETRPQAGPPSASADGVDRGRGGGVLASLWSELLVVSRWPAMWALVLAFPVFTLLDSYVEQYVLYLNAGTGAIVLASPSEVLPTILPGQLVPAVLNSIGHAAQERHRRVRRHAAVGHDRAAPAGPVRRGTVRAAAYDLRLPARRQHQHRHEPVRRGQTRNTRLPSARSLRCWPSRSSSSTPWPASCFRSSRPVGEKSSNGVTVRLGWRL